MRYRVREREILECVDEARGKPRQCVKHALMHLDRAWRLKLRDPEMAIFRAITAEEEAATAILLSLRQLGYDRADKLSFRSHTHKQAVIPFFRAIECCFSKFAGGVSLARWGVEPRHQKKRLFLELVLPDGTTARSDPPLGFTAADSATGSPMDFEKSMDAVVAAHGLSDTLAYLRERANRRNRLLYAGEQGIPTLDGPAEPFVLGAKKHVMLLLGVFCLIFPYRQKALFVQQALDAFLLLLGKVEKQDIDW